MQDWNTEREWPDRYVRGLLRAIVNDMRQEHFSIDLHDKLADRKISIQEVWTAITNTDSYIARYWYYSGNRVGIWRPKTRLFVAWKPHKGQSPSRIMTAFRHYDGVRYMQGFPPFREIRGPQR